MGNSRPCSRIILWCENESHVNHDHDDDVTEDDVNDEEDISFQSAKEGFGFGDGPTIFPKNDICGLCRHHYDLCSMCGGLLAFGRRRVAVWPRWKRMHSQPQKSFFPG